MKKFLTSAVAASVMFGSTAAATAAPVIDRDIAPVTEAEALDGENGILFAILAAAAIIAGIILLEDSEDEDLPTSP